MSDRLIVGSLLDSGGTAHVSAENAKPDQVEQLVRRVLAAEILDDHAAEDNAAAELDALPLEQRRLGWANVQRYERMLGIRRGPMVANEGTTRIDVEPWKEFAERATEHVPCLVDDLWPEGALGFIGAPPKCGKTWLGIALAISVATGRRLFGRYRIPDARPVLYIALEGHRAALRARVGCIARGLGVDPDTDELDRLAFAYKPRGINLADESWAAALAHHARELDAGLIVVDVLRAAARIRENESGDFRRLRENLTGLLDEARSLALLHHFGKLNETNRDRSAGERMAGTGAMQGALDVGVYITQVEGGRVFHLDEQILAAVRAADGAPLSKNRIAEMVEARKKDVLQRIDALSRDGALDHVSGKGYVIAQDRFPGDGNHQEPPCGGQPGQVVPGGSEAQRERVGGSPAPTGREPTLREPPEEPGGSHVPDLDREEDR